MIYQGEILQVSELKRYRIKEPHSWYQNSFTISEFLINIRNQSGLVGNDFSSFLIKPVTTI